MKWYQWRTGFSFLASGTMAIKYASEARWGLTIFWTLWTFLIYYGWLGQGEKEVDKVKEA
jgi:hypothetical protein